jgi:hypothetical protein
LSFRHDVSDGVGKAVDPGSGRDGGCGFGGRHHAILRQTRVLRASWIPVLGRRENTFSPIPTAAAKLLHPAQLTDPGLSVTVTRFLSSLVLFSTNPNRIITDVSAL